MSVYSAPEDFQNRLARQFNNRLRIRWSHKRQEWQIEYKVSHQRIAKFWVSDNDDAAIRARDGYAFILAVSRGTKSPCPRCGYDLDVPAFEIQEVRCQYCRLSGRDGRYPVVYFPLEGDSLLQHLRRIDPLNTYREGMVQAADARNAAMLKSKERDLSNIVEAAVKQDYKELVGIPTVGFGGIKRFEG